MSERYQIFNMYLVDGLKQFATIHDGEAAAAEALIAAANRAESAEALLQEAVRTGSEQAAEWDRFWSAMGVASESVTVDDAIVKYKAIEDAANRAEAERWVSVKERLPEPYERVQVLFHTGYCEISRRFGNDWRGEGAHLIKEPPMQWRPLPTTSKGA